MLTLLGCLLLATGSAALGLIAGEELCDALAYKRKLVSTPARVLAALSLPAIAVAGTLGAVLRKITPEDVRDAVADLWEVAVYGRSS